MNWKEYEKEIFNFFSADYPNAEITHNVKKVGRYSGVQRQIDILVEDYIAGNRISIVIDGKYFNSKIDVKEVESFIGMLEDIGAHKGLLISKEGFSEAAKARAYNGPSDIELDVLNFEDLKDFQGQMAFPHAGSNGVVLKAPFGWVIDNTKNPFGLATLYQQGLTLEEALEIKEFIYVQFWDKQKDNQTLDELILIQENNIKDTDPTAKIEYIGTIKRDDRNTKLRAAHIKNYPTPEYTGYVEFEKFIFFCVLFTPDVSKHKNIRKLENIMGSVLPIGIAHEKS